MEAALHLRESYSQQFLQDLFQEEDFDEEGQLTRQQVERLLRSGAMQCDEEGVQELLAALDFDEDGYASVGRCACSLALGRWRYTARVDAEGRTGGAAHGGLRAAALRRLPALQPHVRLLEAIQS